jgi:hypothetical protein
MGQIQTQSDQFLDHLNFRPGITDIPCPVCGPNCKAASNRRRKVLRVWNNDGFITYNCARCGAQGVATGDKPMPATPLPQKDNRERMALAERLWGMSKSPTSAAGAWVNVYLKNRSCWLLTPSIRFLPQNGRHYPTMIAKFSGVSAVHLTRLDLSVAMIVGKAGTDHDKVIIGPCSGFPIVLRSSKWTRPLLICEGIEDGLSLALAFPRWTVWAAGSAGHIHKLVGVADKQVIVVVDDDLAGQKAADRSLSINPETYVIKFQKGLDPNAILVKHGLNALRQEVSRHQPFHR